MPPRSRSEYYDPVKRRLIPLDSFDYEPKLGSADDMIQRARRANASTSFASFNKFPLEVQRMVWKEAAKQEMKNRVVPLVKHEPKGQDLVLQPTPALSSPLLKTCRDSRAAFLPLVPSALDVFGCGNHRCGRGDGCQHCCGYSYGCKKCHKCPKCCCDCNNPSGTVYINPASDIAVWFQLPLSAPSGRESWLSGFCGHHRVTQVDDVRDTFRRLIAMSWDQEDRNLSDGYKPPFLPPNSVAMLRMAIPYQLSSVEEIRYNTYEELMCNGLDSEEAEEQAIAETIIDESYVPDVTSEYVNVHLWDLCHCLQTQSGPEFLALYRHCFFKDKRGDLPKKGELFAIDRAEEDLHENKRRG